PECKGVADPCGQLVDGVERRWADNNGVRWWQQVGFVHAAVLVRHRVPGLVLQSGTVDEPKRIRGCHDARFPAPSLRPRYQLAHFAGPGRTADHDVQDAWATRAIHALPSPTR